jgi:2-amino-4-hydroxy-6-hydroxymethyldihydropteridine diphosphokinase
VGLGANLGDRESVIRRAVELLDAEAAVRVLHVSTLRETEPWGYMQQPPFLNGACSIETTLAPQELLDVLLTIEGALGRRRDGHRYGPRAIDLDLLLYGDETVDLPNLAVPHPRLVERAFVLEPLAELDPELQLPDGRRVSELLAGLQ